MLFPYRFCLVIGA